jgi:uncharacterized protein (DUF433 family)
MRDLISPTGRILGTRSTVYEVVHYLENGRTAEEIAGFANLSLEQVEAAIKYIDANREAVMAVHRQIEERIARGNPPEVLAKLEETRERMRLWLEERAQAKRQEANGVGTNRRPQP